MRLNCSIREATAWVLAVCAVVAGGCAECRAPQIDPTGQHVLAPPPPETPTRLREEPGKQLPWDTVGLTVSPQVTLAPVGSEVILVAGVIGHDGYYRMNERVEWQLAPGGVGEFLDFDRGSWCDVLVLDFTSPRKISSTQVIGNTSRQSIRLTRGGAPAAEQVTVISGQTWVSLTSPVEGTSYVTAFAPEVYGWDRRTRTATIHWVDVQWILPPPAINPAGTRHVFTTTVMRQSNQTPCAGWRVVYTIAGGPPAAFAPSGAQSIEVSTDAAGHASAEIVQAQPTAGTNQINIQVIRPALPGGTALNVGGGVTFKTWSAPGICLRKAGPSVAAVGSTVTYRIQVSNPGDQAANGIVLSDEIPDNATFVSSNPPGQPVGRTVQWQIGRLGPGETRCVETNLRAERPGNLNACAEAVGEGGLKAKDCATTLVAVNPPVVTAPPCMTLPPPPVSSAPGPLPGAAPGAGRLEVRITRFFGDSPTSDDRAAIGDTVTYGIALINRGTTTLNDLVLVDRFDSGLEMGNPPVPSPIRNDKYKVLPPGESRTIGVRFRAVRPGQACQTVEVTAAGGIRETARKCLDIAQYSNHRPVAPTDGTSRGESNKIMARISVPPSATVGQTVNLNLEVTNQGQTPVTDVQVSAIADRALNPQQSDLPWRLEGDVYRWTLDMVFPGKTRTITVPCVCRQPAASAGIQMTAVAKEGPRDQDNRRIRIMPPAESASNTGPLDMTVSTLSNPVTMGKVFSYQVTVTNRGATADSQVALVVNLPSQLAPDQLRTAAPTPEATPEIKGQAVSFKPVTQLRPGEKIVYRIYVQAREPGDVQIQTQLTSRAVQQPLLVYGRITILPERSRLPDGL